LEHHLKHFVSLELVYFALWVELFRKKLETTCSIRFEDGLGNLKNYSVNML